MVAFLSRLNPETDVTSAITFRCGRCKEQPHRADAIEMTGSMPYVTPPVPRGKGVEHRADLAIDGVKLNSDVRSWCHHDDREVTIEVWQVVVLPVDFVANLGLLDEKVRDHELIAGVGSVVLQTMQSVGFHCAEVSFCQSGKSGECRHQVQA
jgi:hypothetical protein